MNFFTDEKYEELFTEPLKPTLYDVGDTVSGKYLITGILSGGENSDVYKATDTLRDADVVIKYVKGSAFDEETSKIQNHAVDELKKWSAIPHHSGIVPVCDGFYDMRIQKFAVVSPFIESTHPMGLTLADLMENGYVFNMDDADFLIFEIYKIIADLKKTTGKLYVHKDIRPENIFAVAPENSSVFTDCTVVLADCGSYSSYSLWLPDNFRSLTPPARDVYMLINTARKMCKELTGKLAVFCDSLNAESTILDFENYFGSVCSELKADTYDALESLIIAYNGFTFTEKASEKSAEFTKHFNNLCTQYTDKYKDSVLPSFLAIKDSQHCDRHDDALKRMELLSQHADLWDKSPARFFCEYSRDFSAEMLITLAISAFQHTDLFNASTKERERLCNLFKCIDLTECFDLSFLDYAAELCEFMLIFEGDRSLLDQVASNICNLSDTEENASPQLKRDRRLWRNVFGCMNAETKEEKSEFAHDTAELLKAEPCNVCCLFYTAKLFMLSSEFTAAKPYCFLTTDIIDCIFNHIVQKDTSKTFLQYQALTSYWTGSFELAQYYCKKALGLLTKDTEGNVSVPSSVAKFNALMSHIESEKTIFCKDTKPDYEKISSIENNRDIYFEEKSNLYNVAARMKYISSVPNALTEEISKTNRIDIEKLTKAIDSLESIDKDLPEAAYMAAHFFDITKQFDHAEYAIKDYCTKMRFSYPENPFNKNDERNEMHKIFYSQIKKETVDFIANMLNVNILIAEENKNIEQKENDYGTDIEYY